MTNKFELNLNSQEIGKRVRSILGLPEEFLANDVISSPVFLTKTEKFINKSIKEYKDLIEDDFEFDLLNIASIYYLCYLLCIGMDARLPKQMENLSTKTIFQNISWDEKAQEMLNKALETIDEFLDEYDIEVEDSYVTIAELSEEKEYPESNI